MVRRNRSNLTTTTGKMPKSEISGNVVTNVITKTQAKNIKSPVNSRISTHSTALSKQKYVIKSQKLVKTRNYGRQKIVMNPKTGKPYPKPLSSIDWWRSLGTKPQLRALTDQLLVKHRNCCVVRFCETPKHKGYHLSKLLAFEIRKVLRTMAVHLQRIELEFLGIRQKYMVNLLTKVAISANTRNTNCWWPHKTLPSMVSLIHWIQTHYTLLASGVDQHECLDLTFYLCDQGRRLHKVNLSIVQVYVNEMDERSKSSLYHFLKGLYGPRKPDHSMLSDFLSEYFTNTGEWLTWLLFDIPVVNGLSTISEYVYRLVKVTGASFERAGEHHSADTSLKINLPNIKVFSPQTECAEAREELQLETYGNGRKIFGHKFPISSDNNFADPQVNKDLSHWYSSMDKVFSKLIMAMHVYYDHKFEDCSWEKCMRSSRERLDGEAAKRARSRVAHTTSEQLRTYYDQFKAANAAYVNLTKEMKRSNDARILKPFVREKNQELAEHVGNIQLERAEYSKMRVSRLLNKELALKHEITF